jgi:hypothetical protein
VIFVPSAASGGLKGKKERQMPDGIMSAKKRHYADRHRQQLPLSETQSKEIRRFIIWIR